MDPEDYAGSISLFAGNYVTSGYYECDGKLYPISDDEKLYAVIGTFYGGDGRSTFGMPDLRGRTPIGRGQHPGSSFNYAVGNQGGAEYVKLDIVNMPEHNHDATLTKMEAVSNARWQNAVIEAQATAQCNNTSSNTFAPHDAVPGMTGTNIYNSVPDGSPMFPNFITATATLLHLDIDVTTMVTGSVDVMNAGSSEPFLVLSPFLAITYQINRNGNFPPRP